MDAEKLTKGLQVFVVGFSGVFLNLVILMAAVKALAWGVAASQKKAGGDEK